MCADLNLHSLKLPDRNFFFDDAMEIISGKFVLALSLSLSLSPSPSSPPLPLTTPPPLYTELPGLPLVSLDLMDYCHVTDRGIAFLSSMNSLTHLSLSRTKLTDNGMPFIQGQENFNTELPVQTCTCICTFVQV